MGEIIYLDGKLIPREQAKISLYDYGFLYGYGLYETLRAYEGKPFRLDNHLARLRYSGNRLGIPVHTALIRDAVLDVIEANNFPQTRLRITVSAGEGSMTPDLTSCTLPTIAVLAGEYKPLSAETYKQGYRVVYSDTRRNSRSPVTYMKSANTMENMLARQEAREIGANEALFLNEKGQLTEAAGSNIFVVKDGVLKTPRFRAGILPGVTRVLVFELAMEMGIRVKEINILPSELLDADEAFLTNSLIEIVPLTMVGDATINDGQPGPVTLKLMGAYRNLVKKETGS